MAQGAMTERCDGTCAMNQLGLFRQLFTPLRRAARATSPQGEAFGFAKNGAPAPFFFVSAGGDNGAKTWYDSFIPLLFRQGQKKFANCCNQAGNFVVFFKRPFRGAPRCILKKREETSMGSISQIIGEVKKVIVGKDRTLLWVLTTILARGHILLEDIPGVGKTTMALAFSKALGLSYSRVQFTPDVLPSDITGYSVYQKETGTMVYQPGAVLTNVFLADELNRATSRTQSALLEAMEEGQVTVDGETHPLPQPFFVIATQNPTGASGTQLLPDSQMDRFTIRLSIGYPSPADERELVIGRQQGNPLDQVRQVVSRQELLALQNQADSVYIKPEVVDYMVALIGATRDHPMILRGASPRATLSMASMAKAVAMLKGRDFVTPDDVKTVLIDTISHRLLLAPEAEARGVSAATLLQEILRKTPSPKLR